MEQRVSIVTIGVKSLEASIAFYERLGWKRAMKAAEGIAFFQTGGSAFALYPIEDYVRDTGVDADAIGSRSAVALAHNTRDKASVDAVLTEAKAAGATITKPAADTFWGGYAGAFTDPDGFVWEIAWNPGFPMDDDGNIAVPD